MITCLLQMIPKVCVDCIPKAKCTQIGLQKKTVNRDMSDTLLWINEGLLC